MSNNYLSERRINETIYKETANEVCDFRIFFRCASPHFIRERGTHGIITVESNIYIDINVHKDGEEEEIAFKLKWPLPNVIIIGAPLYCLVVCKHCIYGVYLCMYACTHVSTHRTCCCCTAWLFFKLLRNRLYPIRAPYLTTQS